MSTFQGISMSECTVQLWYNKQRIKKNGDASLYLQIIVGGEHSEIKLKGLQWPAEKINWEKKMLMPRRKVDEDLLTFNAIIERERAKYWSIVLNFLKEDKPFKLADIFNEHNLYRNGNLFCDFMEQAIKDRQRTTVKKDMIKASTAASHRVALGWFREFLNFKDIEITKIDDRVIERFADYISDEMLPGSVWSKVKNIKSYISYAFRNKIMINHDHKRFTLRMPESDPTWLNESEIKCLMDIYQDRNGENPKLVPEHMKNLRAFLFASFTGLRISDLSRWNKDWIEEDHISFVPQKIKKSNRHPKPVKIPIIPIARQFIADLSTDTFQVPKDQAFNRALKTIANAAGIKKNLTSHVARHTFATWLAIEGVPPIVISKILGHKSMITTMIYIHIAEDYMAREMMKIQKRFTLQPVD